MSWTSEKYINLNGNERPPIPTREDIVGWVENAWSMISSDMIRNTFEHIGYTKDDMTPPSTPYPEFVDTANMAEPGDDEDFCSVSGF